MTEFVMPQVECVESSEKYGRFVAEPLEKGYGVTLGNALRRVLLSSLPGAAVTWVKIEGVLHEFSTIPHVKEDTVEFLLNVKALRLRPLSSTEGKLFLEAEGEGRFCAGDIKPSADFEIANPDLHLATLDSPEAKLIVEFNVEQGKGYVPTCRGDGLSIGVIPVDAIFTPIRKVNFTVEHTRVGQVTSYERLILEMWTDGTISPLEALSKAAQLLVEKFQLFYELAYVPLKGEGIPPEQYNIPIEQLNLSSRTFNCLKRAGIAKVGELLEYSDEELLKIKNLGQKALEELRGQLRTMGFVPEEEIPAEEETVVQEEGGEGEDLE